MAGDYRGRGVATLVALAVVCSLSAGLAVAGDASGVLAVEPREVTAAPGETVEVSVTLQTDGGYTGAGLASYEYALVTNPDIVTVTDIDHGVWPEGGNYTVETAANVTAGRAVVRHDIREADEGVTGTGTTATFTLAIAEDAPPSSVVVGIAGADGEYTSEYPMSTYVRNGTITVDGGGPELGPADDPDALEEGGTPASGDTATPTDDGVDVTLAEDVGRDVETGEHGEKTTVAATTSSEAAADGSEGTDGNGASGSFPLVEFAVVAGIVVLVTLATVGLRR